MDNSQTIVIDIGSGFCKAGFATDKLPRSIFPSIIGNPRHKGSFIGEKSQDVYAGNQAFSKIGILNVQYPIRYGLIANWNDFTTLLRYAYEDELHVNYAEHPVLLAESSRSDNRQREKLLQVMFETFQVPSLYIGNSNVLSLYTTGKKTGVVVDIGYEMTQIAPIVDNSIIQSAMTIQNFGGQALTNYYLKALKERGCPLSELSASLAASEIKEKLGYVALDFEAEVAKNSSSHECDTTYTTQDGDEFKVSDERYKVAELLLNPQLEKLDYLGIQKLVAESVSKCEKNVQAQLFQNVVLCGGSSLFDGLPGRLEKELNAISKADVIAQKNRNYAAWIGGTTFAGLPEFESGSIKSEVYREKGAKNCL